MNAAISPKLLRLVSAGSLVLDMWLQAGSAGAARTDATYTTIDVPGATSTVPLDVNSAGEIVGRYLTAGNTHGFLRNTKGELTTIDFPGAVFTVAAGTNSRGDIVGMFRRGSELQTVRHGFLLRAGEFTTIDPPGALFTNALGVNPRGDIVGRYCTTIMVACTPESVNVHGFLLGAGRFTTIDFPGAVATNAWKINPYSVRWSGGLGQIVGGYAAADGETHLFRLREGRFSTIDARGGIALTLDNGGINALGDIVGTYHDTAPCTSASTDVHGFLLLSRGDFTTMDFPGASITSAFGVNARRDIVGLYIDTTGKTHGYLRKSSDGVPENGL